MFTFLHFSFGRGVSQRILDIVTGGGWDTSADGMEVLSGPERALRMTRRATLRDASRCSTNSSGQRVFDSNGVRSKSTRLAEGIQVGCYHAMASKAYSDAKQVALALDCTDVASEVLGTAACRVVDGSPEPVSTVWLPLKVFAATCVRTVATNKQKHEFELSQQPNRNMLS